MKEGVKMQNSVKDKNSNYPNFVLTEYVGAKAQNNAPTSIDSLNYKQQITLIKICSIVLPFFLLTLFIFHNFIFSAIFLFFILIIASFLFGYKPKTSTQDNMFSALLLRAKQDRGDMILITCCNKEMSLTGECLQGDILYSSLPIKLSNTAYSSLRTIFKNEKIKPQNVKVDKLEWQKKAFDIPSNYITKQQKWKDEIKNIIQKKEQ